VVEIGGYTDNSGSVEKNITISRQRAEFVYNHLIQSGYNPARISFHGYGPENPIYSNSTKSSREANRRIEIKVISKTGHRSDRLVDEKGTNVQTVSKPQPNRLLSYYLANKTEPGLGNVFVIDSLVFASSSFQLPTTGKGIDNLNALVTYLNENKNIGVTINGYTDASGIEDNNKILSENRAKVVYDYLIKQGISPERLVYNGYGSKNPIATNAYLWGRDQNRRIEVEFRIR
jgi:outer membrane protein OmpA-like peptidoglycan-associated protein